MVEEVKTGVLATLGIDWKLFLAQLVNYGIVVVVLWKWAYQPLLQMLDTRKKKIEESLEKAKEIDTRMKRVGAEEGAMMKAAHEKAQTILVAAETGAKERMQEEVEATKKQVDSMLLKGKEELAAMKSQLILDAKQDLADVVVAAVSKIVGETADKKLHADLVKKAKAVLE